ncbi:hypothetical protein FUA23_08185 [Neolewinella aurantiaca]|uniref:Uncharacterized protein n=1 Tax=Neolewinella aurantiaca TaxID=2602767 RepID=A0A5C7FG49_9BACT|nr:hypothetical protein [Neolewinella aurantiaca]TXF89927.1 hypothetical protein FUA23_08185 [Neolewinella aurantiaca]
MTTNSAPEKKKPAPYKTIGWVSAFAVVIGVFCVSQFASGQFHPAVLGFLVFCSVAVLLMFALEVYRLYKDYAAGYLFPVRNLTFFIVCLSFIALPAMGIYGMVTGTTLGAANTLLVPVFLWLVVNNLFYVRLDSVGLESKSGFFTSRYVPLFDVTNVEESEGGLIVSQAEGPDIRLFRAFFFGAHWKVLRERLGR